MPTFNFISTSAAGASNAAGANEAHTHRIELLLALFVLFVAAKLGAELFERFRQPAVIGEILSGVLVGPAVLGWVAPSIATETLAEIGVILLMFSVGLETEPRAIWAVGKTALGVAVLGVVLPFVLGTGAALLMIPLIAPSTHDTASSSVLVPAIFVGVAMVATSVGITARVLADMKLLSHGSSRIILAAAVIDDILALLVLSAAAGMASSTGIDWSKIGVTALWSIGFVALTACFGPRLIAFFAPFIQRLKSRDSLFGFAIALCFGMALLAEKIGIAAIIGAFLAGMALADRSHEDDLMHKSETLVHLFLPFFLAGIGMQLKLDVFRNPMIILFAFVLTLLAVVGKLGGAMLGARNLGKRAALQIGVGMVPRGEVGIVVAQMGLSLGVLNQNLFGAVLFMAIATTLLAPPFLRRAFEGEHETTGEEHLATMEENPIDIE